MNLKLSAIIEQDENGFFAYCPDVLSAIPS